MISIIIPVLNEEHGIRKFLQAVKKQGGYEIIVADGGSTDNTVKIARRYAKIVKSPRGRANQMNAGAKKAKGDILLFLHADTFLPKNGVKAIERLLEKNIVGGCFLAKFDNQHWLLRLGDWYRNWRTKHLKCFYGDQAMFVRVSVFKKIGGFKPVPIMEDYDFCTAMKKQGKIGVVPKKVTTSARRYLERGILRQHIGNQFIKFLYNLGVSPKKLARIYYTIR